MSRPSPRPIDMRAERRAMVALLAIFALVVQTLWPTLATAAAADLGPAAQICTDHGLVPAPADPAKGQPSGSCQHCLCPAPALSAPAHFATSAPLRFVVASAPAGGLRATAPPPARAPPRPPGQGPPFPNA